MPVAVGRFSFFSWVCYAVFAGKSVGRVFISCPSFFFFLSRSDVESWKRCIPTWSFHFSRLQERFRKTEPGESKEEQLLLLALISFLGLSFFF